MKRFLSAAALAGVFITTAGAAESVYTPTTGRTCRQTTENSHLSVWQCRGPAGYVAEFGDEGNVVFVAIGFRGRFDERDYEGLIWRGADKVFGDKLEWRLTNGRPTAAILRAWRLETDDEGVDHTIQELLVIKVTRAGGCRAGSVDARRPDANAAARDLADTVAAFRCGHDKPTHVGLEPS